VVPVVVFVISRREQRWKAASGSPDTKKPRHDCVVSGAFLPVGRA
jgi:hypothetical protein